MIFIARVLAWVKTAPLRFVEWRWDRALAAADRWEKRARALRAKK